MKKILIIILGVASQLAAQGISIKNLNFLPKQDEFAKEFIRLLDSTRRTQDKNPKSINFDQGAYKSCVHHNKYQYELVKNTKDNSLLITHEESRTVLDLFYQGNDSLFKDFLVRTLYFSNNSFFPYGECLWGGYTSHKLYKNLNSIELAKTAFNQFMNSKKGHREALVDTRYNAVGVSLWTDAESTRFYVAVITGKN